MLDEKNLNDENEELNAEYENNDGDYDNYQNNALNKNTNVNILFNLYQNFRTGSSNQNAKHQFSKAELDTIN